MQKKEFEEKIVPALRFVEEIVSEFETQVAQNAKKFQVFFDYIEINLEENGAFIEVETTTQLESGSNLSVTSFEELLDSGFSVIKSPVRAKPETRVITTNQITRTSLQEFVRDAPTVGFVEPTRKHLSALSRVNTDDNIDPLVFRVTHRLVYPFTNLAIPLVQGRAYEISVSVQPKEQLFTLDLTGHMVIELFGKFHLPEIEGWAWEKVENAQTVYRTETRPAFTDADFHALVFEGEKFTTDSLKSQIHELEGKLWYSWFSSEWELASAEFKLGLAYFRLASLEPCLTYYERAKDALVKMVTKNYRDLYFRKNVVGRLIAECEKTLAAVVPSLDGVSTPTEILTE